MAAVIHLLHPTATIVQLVLTMLRRGANGCMIREIGSNENDNNVRECRKTQSLQPRS